MHRDVKPANIILTTDGTVKITDFGIAKMETSNLTETGQFLGTPNYMSPEQVTGEVVDGRSDLFSLGVVLYELLTKTKPFAGDNLTSISYKIVHEEYPSPQTYDAAIPVELNPILARALAKDPAARFQSGKDFVGALSEFRARHAEMEMLKDLGEMVAQAERLGPVSAVESKQNPLPAPTQLPAAAAARARAPSVSAEARRASRTSRGGDGATSTRPSSGRPPPASTAPFRTGASTRTLEVARGARGGQEARERARRAGAVLARDAHLRTSRAGRRRRPRGAARRRRRSSTRRTAHGEDPDDPRARSRQPRPRARDLDRGDPRPPASRRCRPPDPTPPRGVPPLNGPVAPRVIAPPTPVKGVPPLAPDAVSAAPSLLALSSAAARRRRRLPFRRDAGAAGGSSPARVRAAGAARAGRRDGDSCRRNRAADPSARAAPGAFRRPRRRPRPGSARGPRRLRARPAERAAAPRPSAAPSRPARDIRARSLAASDGVQPVDPAGGAKEPLEELREVLQGT